MKKSISSVAIVIVIITMTTKMFGLLRETLLANYYGTNYITDAFLTSQSIVGIFFGWMSSFETSYVPCYFYSWNQEKKSRVRVNTFTSSLLTLSIIASFVCIFIGFLAADFFIALSVPGFSGDVLSLTKIFYQQYLFVLPCLLPTAVLLSYIKCNGAYITNNAVQLVLSAGIMLIIVLSTVTGYQWMIWELVTLNYIYLFAVYICARHCGYRFRLLLKKSEELIRLLKLTIPVFLSSMLAEINGYVDKVFSSLLDEGAITSLNYAWLLVRAVAYLFISCITTLLYPKLSSEIANGRIENAKKIYFNSAYIIILICIPVIIIFVLYSDTVVRLVFMRGSFDANSLLMTVGPFIGYAFILLPFVFNSLTQNLFYAFSLNKYMTVISVIGMVTNIVADYMLVSIFRHTGLAVATTVVAYITSIAYAIILKKKGNWGFGRLGIVIGKSLIAATPAILIHYIFIKIGFGEYLSLRFVGLHFLALFASLVVYIFVLTYIFKDKLVISLINKAKGRLKS